MSRKPTANERAGNSSQNSCGDAEQAGTTEATRKSTTDSSQDFRPNTTSDGIQGCTEECNNGGAHQ